MHSVLNEDNAKTYDVNKDELLFDALEKQGHILPHGCLAGSCGACKIIILDGIDKLAPASFIEKNTIVSILQNYKGSEDLSGKTVRLACRTKVNGDMKFKVLK
jgi:ferredoxin